MNYHLTDSSLVNSHYKQLLDELPPNEQLLNELPPYKQLLNGVPSNEHGLDKFSYDEPPCV
jgi:hypothetical protein